MDRGGITTCYLMLLLCTLPGAARADCVASEGEPQRIESDGVTVDCNAEEPNPFTGGIGSQLTDTNLTVNIAPEAGVDTAGVGVTLAGGGNLDNQGSLSASGATVLVTDAQGTGAPTIDNGGDIESSDEAGIDIATGFGSAGVDNSGSIRARTFGVRLSGGSVDNSGTIDVTGNTGVGIQAGSGASITNSGSIDSTVTGISAEDGTINNSGDIRVTRAESVAISAGEAAVDNAGTISSAGEGLRLSGTGSLNNSGSISAAVAAVSAGSGSTVVNSGEIVSDTAAAVSAAGNVSITNSGSLQGSADAVLLSGGGNTLTLQSGSNISGAIRSVFDTAPTDSLVLEGGGSLGSDVENFGAVVMRGDSWTLSGAVSAREVSIESGRLNINGTLDTRVGGVGRDSIELLQATLGGSGRVIADVNNSTGTLAPGSPGGTLTIDGNYSQGAAGVMRINSAGSGASRLRVTGTATLAGTVIVQAGSDGVFDFLTAEGGINGEFDELQVDGRALVSLLPSANTLRFVRASTTVQDNVVHAALDAAVLNLDGLQTGSRSDGQRGPWIKPLGHYGDRDEEEGLPGGDFTIGGGMAGVDWNIGNFRFGAGAGYTRTDLDIDDGGEGETDNTVYGAWVEYVTPRFHGSLTISGASGEFEHERSVFVNDVRSTVSADYDGDTLAVRLAVGGNRPMRGRWGGSWLFEPELRADYISLDLDPYTETGGTGLEVEAVDDIEAAEFAALFHAYRAEAGDAGIAPRVHVGVVHRLAIDDREWSAVDSASGTVLVLPGDDEEQTAFRFGAGADFNIGRRWHANIDYLGELGDNGQGHSLVAGIKLRL